MTKKILLIGGGGHCKSVLDSLLETNEYSEIGIIDDNVSVSVNSMGVSVVGTDKDLLDLLNRGFEFAFVTVGSIGNPSVRIELFHKIKQIGFKIPNVIDKTATVSQYAKIENGVFIGKQCIVNAGSHIGKGVIVNSGSIVEHDCMIGDFSHIAPAAVLGGNVVIGENSHIGSNSTIKQQVHIGSNSIIGMGSVVLKDVSSNTMSYGNPSREVRKL